MNLKNDVMNVLGTYLKQKNYKHPLTGKGLSKLKRMDNMYEIVRNQNYCYKFTKDEQLLANELIKCIINEE